MTMHSEFKMHFTLWGRGFDPGTITKLVGIQPTETYREGDQVSKTIKMRMKCDGWRVSSSLPLDAPFTDHVPALLAIVNPKQPEIVAACEQHSLHAELLAVIYCYEGDRPGMYLRREEVAQIAALGATIDLDLYNFP